jgi:hypothetical protein
VPKSLGTSTAPALASAPAVGVAGALYYNTADGNLYKSNGAAWSAVGGSGGGPTLSDTAPGSPTAGQLWYETDTGILYVYYDSFWIEVGGAAVGGFVVSDTAPTSPVSGMGWFKSDTGQSYVYVSSAWVEMAGGPTGPIGQSTKEWTKTGTLTTTTGSLAFPLPFDGTILGISARVTTAPTGASILLDVNKNGTTIFTTQANRPAIVASALATATEVQNMDITTFVAGDYLTIDIDQIGSTIAGSNLTVVVRYRDAYGAAAELPAQVLLSTTTFAAAASVSVNNCFTSAFRNYVAEVDITATSTNQNVTFKLRVGGADNSTALYDYGVARHPSAGAISAVFQGQVATSATIQELTSASFMTNPMMLTFFAPQATEFTAMMVDAVGGPFGVGNVSRLTGAVSHRVAASYDGFTLAVGGTITGTIKVYGLR